MSYLQLRNQASPDPVGVLTSLTPEARNRIIDNINMQIGSIPKKSLLSVQPSTENVLATNQ